MTTNPAQSHVLVTADNVAALYKALAARHQQVFFAKNASAFHEGLTTEQVLRPPYKPIILGLGFGYAISGQNPVGMPTMLSIGMELHQVLIQPEGRRPTEWETLEGGVYAFIPREHIQPPADWQQLFSTGK